MSYLVLKVILHQFTVWRLYLHKPGDERILSVLAKAVDYTVYKLLMLMKSHCHTT